MPIAPPRLCRCGRRTTGNCVCQQARQAKADVTRGTAQERGYDYPWAVFSRRWRKQYPICGMRADGVIHVEHSRCAQDGKFTQVDLVVDHILPMADGGEKFELANLQTLCRACNTAKDTGWRRAS